MVKCEGMLQTKHTAVSISDKLSYRKISRRQELARLGDKSSYRIKFGRRLSYKHILPALRFVTSYDTAMRYLNGPQCQD